jgi:FAD/FMN-containing dehydrogenase
VSEGNKRSGYVVSHDSVVPLERQAAFVNNVEARIKAAVPHANVVMHGHIGDGNIHVVVLFPHERFADVQAYEDASDAIDIIVDDISVAMGGSITAEHGVGTSYRKRLARTKNGAELTLMKGIKQLLDPAGLMNPGKIFLEAGGE